MRRLLLLAMALILSAGLGLAHAQQVPGTLLDPTQVDPNLSQVIADYAGQVGYTYLGACGLYAPDQGQVCSQVYLQNDGSVSVVLVDSTNASPSTLQAVPQSDGSWVIAGTGNPSSTPQPTAAPAPTPTPIPAATSAPSITYLQSLPPGSTPPGALGTPPTDRWYYLFRISGPAISGPLGGSNGQGVTLQPAVLFAWGRTNDSNLIYVGLTAGAQSGTYTLTVPLPTGPSVSVTFKHPGGS